MTSTIKEGWESYKRDVLEKAGIAGVETETFVSACRGVFYAGANQFWNMLAEANSESSVKTVLDSVDKELTEFLREIGKA